MNVKLTADIPNQLGQTTPQHPSSTASESPTATERRRRRFQGSPRINHARVLFLPPLFALAMGLLAISASLGVAQETTPSVHDQIQGLQAQLDQLKAEQGMDVMPAVGVDAQFASLPGDCRCFGSQSRSSAAAGKQYPLVRLTGFFQTDAGWFYQDAANISALGDIQDGADFRRARLAATGDAWNNVGYMLEMDFAFPGRPSFMDVWLEVRDTLGGNLRIGQYRQPFGMDGLTSVKELTFLERALPFAFLPFRQIGVMYYGQTPGERATWAVSGFRFPTDAYGGNIGDDGGYGLACRLTGLLIDTGQDGGVLHLGGGYSFGDPANNLVRYRNQPEFFVAETGGAALVPIGVPFDVPPFVDTGLIRTSNFNLFNAELAASSGSFHVQSELYYAVVNQIGDPLLTFSGAYAHAGFFLTGESRPYNRKAGVFGRVDPRAPFGSGGCGAWEIAARWSYINLNDENVLGGRLNDLTCGVNWYLNRHTKFQFNYIHAFLQSSPALYGPIVNDSNADIFAVRAQVDF